MWSAITGPRAAEVETAAEGTLSNGLLDRLRESEERFRAIFEQAAVGVAEIETQTGRFTQVNRKYCDIVGLEAQDLAATTFMAITHPDDLQANLDHMERLKAGEIHDFSIDKRYIRPDGGFTWVNLTVSPMWGIGEQPVHHIAVVEDITDRKRAEEALRQSEARFRLVLDTVRDPIVTIDADARIGSVNPAAGMLFGYPVSELVGQPITILIPESLRAAHTAGFHRYVETGERHIEWEGVHLRGRHKSGAEIPLEVSFGEFVSGGTRVFTGILHDISAHERIEAELRSDALELKQTNVSFSRVLQAEFVEKETREKLAKITTKVDSGFTLDDVLEQMFEAFETVIPYDRMGCALVEDNEQTTRSIWVRSTLPEVQIPVGYSARLEGSSLQGVLESGRPRVLNDLEAYLREHPDSENTRRIVAEGMRSSLTCPLIALGKPVGFVFFSSTRTNAYDDSHVESYLRIAEHISLIVEKGELYRQLVETKREVERRNAFISKVFGRYTSEAVVSELLEAPEGLTMGGETRKVTILMADLCGFTPLCATLDPQRVVRLLNIHLGVMTDVILDHGGTINEFLGDAILAFFGAPVLAGDHAQRALACAIAMQRAMEDVNKRLSEEGFSALEMGIAVHTGDVVAGNIGSERRAKYSIVGQAVNLVGRIEERTPGGRILCSEDTLREVGDIVDFDEGVEVRAKGLSEPVPTVSVRKLRFQPEIQP